LASVKYDISNAERTTTNEDGQLTGDNLDIKTGIYTAHYFQCCDIRLATGLNRIALQATGLAGNTFTTNLNITLDYSKATSPIIQLLWPKEGMELCGNSFTVRGQVQGAASTVAGTITDTNGNSVTVSGVVERTGRLWLDNLPLHDGTNRLMLSVTNSAGLVSSTNLSVIRSSFILRMDPVNGDLWLPTISVSGFESDATYPVWVNGVKAVVSVNSDGTGKWVAEKVPVTEGGVASFDMYAYGPDEIQPDGLYGNGKPASPSLVATNASSKKLVSKDTVTPTSKPLVGVQII
jgi:hypothetical protein